jgi:hypothetical protein
MMANVFLFGFICFLLACVVVNSPSGRSELSPDPSSFRHAGDFAHGFLPFLK